jgi:hypothetical protein
LVEEKAKRAGAPQPTETIGGVRSPVRTGLQPAIPC